MLSLSGSVSMKQVIRLLGCGRHSLSGALVTDLRVAYAPPTGASQEAVARFSLRPDSKPHSEWFCYLLHRGSIMRRKIVFLLLLFGLAGCAAPGTLSPPPAPETTLPLPAGSLASSPSGPTPTSVAPFSTQEPTEAWKRVSDDGYKYSFWVPATWILDKEGVTPDRLVFFSDPTVVGQVGPLTFPNGLIKLDFAADPIGKGEPDLTKANPITVADRPA